LLKYSDKIKPWMLIRTKFNNDLWYPNILISVENKGLVIPLIKNHINSNILEHDFIKVSFNINQIETTYLCIVEQVLFDDNPKMFLKILKEENWENTRNAERIEVNFISKLILNETIVNSYVTDISLTGCKIISNEQLRQNDTYEIHIFKEDTTNKELLKLYGNIKRRSVKGSKLEYGVQFLNCTDQEIESISRIVEKTHENTKKIMLDLYKKYNHKL
jgi:hypothetical protein